MPATDPHITWILVLSLFSIAVSIALSFMSRWEAVLASLAALVLGQLSGYAYVNVSTLVFWIVTVVIVLGIDFLLPAQVRNSRVGVPHFCTGALVGCAIGMLFNSMAGIITGSAVGVLLSAVALSRLQAGNSLEYPSKKFFNYLCAKGLPLVVIYSILGLLGLQFITAGF